MTYGLFINHWGYHTLWFAGSLEQCEQEAIRLKAIQSPFPTLIETDITPLLVPESR